MRRWLALLVGLYVALDFANPMMPGAVQLVDGSLETVAGCQHRSAESPAPAPTLLPRHLAAVEPPRAPVPLAARVEPARPLVLSLFRPPLESCSRPASSPDDD